MSGEGIYQAVGKTIERVVIKEKVHGGNDPRNQVFLIFTDGTYYELYTSSEDMGFCGRVDTGDRDTVLRYMADCMRVVYEGYLDENGKPVSKYIRG